MERSGGGGLGGLPLPRDIVGRLHEHARRQADLGGSDLIRGFDDGDAAARRMGDGMGRILGAHILGGRSHHPGAQLLLDVIEVDLADRARN
jgi:hypothetical protein